MENNAILSALSARKSVRVFTPDPVTPDERAAILNAAFQAPTAGNQQLYTILDITDPALKAALADLCGHQPFIAGAPLVLVFLADCRRWLNAYHAAGITDARKPGAGDLMLAVADTCIAAQNAVVAAESLGLGSCYIGDIVENAEEVAELLDLPPYTMPLSMLIIGTPRKERPAIAHPVVNLVHEERYCRADAATMDAQVAEMDAMFRPHARVVGERVVDIYTRKHTSPFMAEMSRSMEWWFKNWLGK